MMSTNIIWVFISYLLGLVDGVFSLFDGVRKTISGFLGVNVTIEAWFALWLFIALTVSTYVLSSRQSTIEPVAISAEAGSESVMAFKAEKVAVESALKFLQESFRKGEIPEQLYARLKSFYSDRLDKVNERLASLSRVEELRGIEFELEEAKREFLERLKAPEVVEKSKVEEPVVRREVFPKPAPREVEAPKAEVPKVPELPKISKVEVLEKTKVEVEHTPPPPTPPKGETLVQALRDEMLKELRRLKEIIEKSS